VIIAAAVLKGMDENELADNFVPLDALAFSQTFRALKISY
jgi:hypothetical protein